jgi:hypothetical protein
MRLPGVELSVLSFLCMTIIVGQLLALSLIGAIHQGAAHAEASGITFAAPAGRAEMLLPSLSKVLGISLKTSPQTANEVLLIQVKDVTQQDLLSKIAKVADAEWRQEGNVLRLVRAVSTLRREESVEHRQRIELYRQFLGNRSQEAKSFPQWSQSAADALMKKLQNASDADQEAMSADEFAGLRSLLDQFPVVRAISALLIDMGPETLANIGENERAVFAMRPTFMQQHLGADSDAILSTFVEEQKQIVDAYNQPGYKSLLGRYPSNWFDYPSIQTAPKGNPAAGIGQAILILRREKSGANTVLHADLAVEDGKGLSLGYGGTTFDFALSQPNRPLPNHRAPITLSPICRDFQADYNKMFLHQGVKQGMSMQLRESKEWVHFSIPFPDSPKKSDLSPAVLNGLLHPEEIDPESFTPGDALALAATNLHLNIVADIPDTAYYKFVELFRNESSVGSDDLFNIYGPQFDLAVARSDNWVTVAPPRPAEMRNKQVSRSALGTFLRACLSNKVLRLSDLAAMALGQSKTVRRVDLDGIQIRILFPEIYDDAIIALANSDQLRIFGTLTSAEKDYIDRKEPVPLEILTPAQMNWLSDAVFNVGIGLKTKEGNTVWRFDMPVISEERTDVLANGIRKEGHLNVTVSQDRAILAINKLNGASEDLTPAQLAAELYERESPKTGTPGNYDSFKVGMAVRYSLHYQLESRAVLDTVLKDSSFDPKTKEVGLNDLPGDIKNRVQSILSEVKQMQSRLPGGSRQPPPN